MIMKNSKKIIIFVIFVLALWVNAYAQTPVSPQIETERQMEVEDLSRLGKKAIKVFEEQKEVPVAPPSPGDDALGQQYILKKKTEYRPFSVFADTSLNWTSNVALTKNNPQDDNFFLTTAGASYQPIIRQNLLGEITATYQWFRYDRFTEMNFDSFNIGAGLSYVIPELENLALFARYNYNRLTNSDATNEYYRNNSITFGVFKTFPLARAHYLYTGFSSQFGFATPKLYQRDYHSLVCGYYIDVTQRLSFDLSARLSYVPYQEDGRRDYNESLILNIAYKPKAWLSLYFTSIAAFNQSNRSVFEYNVVNIAPNIGIKVKF